MQSRDESFDDRSRQQLHVLNADQNLGIDESIPGSINDVACSRFLVLKS